VSTGLISFPLSSLPHPDASGRLSISPIRIHQRHPPLSLHALGVQMHHAAAEQ
jgi:hypothetical protein